MTARLLLSLSPESWHDSHHPNQVGTKKRVFVRSGNFTSSRPRHPCQTPGRPGQLDHHRPCRPAVARNGAPGARNDSVFIPNERDLEQDSALHLPLNHHTPKEPKVQGAFFEDSIFMSVQHRDRHMYMAKHIQSYIDQRRERRR